MRARARFMTAFSRRTQNKDLFAVPKILPLNDFLHFARCAQMRDLTAGPGCGSAILDAPGIRAPAETRINTRLSPDHDRPKPAVTFMLTRVPAHETWRTSAIICQLTKAVAFGYVDFDKAGAILMTLAAAIVPGAFFELLLCRVRHGLQHPVGGAALEWLFAESTNRYARGSISIQRLPHHWRAINCFP